MRSCPATAGAVGRTSECTGFVIVAAPAASCFVTRRAFRHRSSCVRRPVSTVGLCVLNSWKKTTTLGGHLYLRFVYCIGQRVGDSERASYKQPQPIHFCISSPTQRSNARKKQQSCLPQTRPDALRTTPPIARGRRSSISAFTSAVRSHRRPLPLDVPTRRPLGDHVELSSSILLSFSLLVRHLHRHRHRGSSAGTSARETKGSPPPTARSSFRHLSLISTDFPEFGTGHGSILPAGLTSDPLPTTSSSTCTCGAAPGLSASQPRCAVAKNMSPTDTVSSRPSYYPPSLKSHHHTTTQNLHPGRC